MDISRKRPHADNDAPTSATKKRALTGVNGSPVTGDSEPDEDPFGEKLESFRKEAIFRRMKHYCREHERSKARIQELEQRKTTCEAGLAAMSACWAQLVDTIRLIVKPDDVSQVKLESSAIFELTADLQHEPPKQLATALDNTVNVTKLLMDKFLQLEESGSASILKTDSFLECQKAQKECAVLRSELNMLRANLKESESQKQSYHDALLLAENRVERLQSATVRETESRDPPKKYKAHEEQKEDVVQSPAHTTRQTSSPSHANGSHELAEVDLLVQQLKLKEETISQLEASVARLQEEKTALELEVKAPSYEQISETVHFKTLSHHAEHLEVSANSKTAQITQLQDDLSNLKATYKEWEENIMRDTAQTLNDYKAVIAKRDADNLRLREQREQQNAELNERRARESIKSSSLQEYKSLLQSNEDRINILQSELRRAKSELAATSRQEDLMTFFLSGNHDEALYFEGLKTKNVQLESCVASLEQSMSQYQPEHPDVVAHMRAESDALLQLADVKSKLDSYERIFGPTSVLSQDASELAGQLRLKEQELEQLRLLEKHRAENETSLFSELEKLSTLWESLDRQLKSKVFDLSSFEERLAKSSHDKVKSDNKYFAAMRERESSEGTRKTQQRTIEKQGKVIDRLTECEQHLRNQLASFEKENSALKKQMGVYKDRLTALDKEMSELRAHLDTEKKRLHELQVINSRREVEVRNVTKAFAQKEEQLVIGKTALEKEVVQLKKKRKLEGSSHNNTKADPDSEKLANLEALITCSTCREVNAFRSTIITKCMHTFCKSCIDARLATRQRKCPACNLAFGHADVHQFFFQ